MSMRLWGVMATLAVAVAGCGTPAQRLAVVQADLRQSQPLVDWLMVKPEHLSGVEPSRLKAEGAALIVVRGLKETASGTRMGGVDGVALRNVSNSTTRLGQTARAGDEGEIGWGVMIVPPGHYALNSGSFRQLVRITASGVRTATIHENGHPYVPLSATINIAPGDVVYVGSVVWEVQSPTDRNPTIRIRNEQAAAAKWTAGHVPAFAGALQTRILPPPVRPQS